ncbi:MAG: hypothetical protein K6F50_06140, partial [Kiritimatiellae bacterium]|nr:hypothetical protein [Kiritimatiellia bacterium]
MTAKLKNRLVEPCFAAALLLALCAAPARANTEWTGGGATGDWNDAANWSGSDGSYRVNHAEMKGSPVTIAFTNMVDVRKGIWIENKLSGAVTFTASSTDYGIAQASSGDFNLNIGTAADSAYYSGALAIDGGAYHFANDVKVGIGTWRNDAYGELTLKSGRVEVAYWMSLGITSNEGHTGETGVLNIEGGDFIVGFRDGAEAEGNSRLTLGASKLSHGIVNQYGGTLSSVANGDAHAYYDALVLGGGESATGAYNMTGGSYTARKGDVLLGAGTGSAGSLNISGGSFTMATGWFKVATGTSSTGTVYVAGGVLAPQGEIHIAGGTNSVASLDVAGGLVTNNSYMVLGRTSGGYDAKLLVTGGEVVNNGITTLGSMAGNGGTALLSMDSGKYTAIGNVFIGEGYEVDSSALSGSATLTVNGGVFDNGSATTTFAANANLTGSAYSSALNLYG